MCERESMDEAFSKLPQEDQDIILDLFDTDNY